MYFNSINFAIFLPIVFVLYWVLNKKSPKFQNLLLLGASYYFYASWDWRFLFLLMFSTLLDYYSGLQLQSNKNENTRKLWFWSSIVINLGFLAVFKYYNFFADSMALALSNLGFKVSLWSLKVILPVGISFYTFHGLSYVIDVYKRRIEPESNFVDYSLFVSFFPLLVAGPIERATHLLPQIKVRRSFDYTKAIDGLRQILWGLVKKVVIADQCAIYANDIFNNSANFSGSTLVMGAFFFAIQIYGDFSGYSDMALGTARLFGIELLQNFSYPYFSRDIAEFWRRWHISLSTWFKDYLYIPLGGSKGNTWSKVRNTFVVFLVSGFWHGANWTFVAWGALNALFIMPSILLKTNRNNLNVVAQGKIFPTPKELMYMVITFSLTCFAWIFFRAENISHALQYISSMANASIFSIPEVLPKKYFIVLLLFFVIEWAGREQKFALEVFGLRWNRVFRWLFYYVLCIAIICMSGEEEQFIYFQF